MTAARQQLWNLRSQLGDQSKRARELLLIFCRPIGSSCPLIPLEYLSLSTSYVACSALPAQRFIPVMEVRSSCSPPMEVERCQTGLIGLAATAIALGQDVAPFLGVIIPPVLACFQDPESRVRYHACESLYNMYVLQWNRGQC